MEVIIMRNTIKTDAGQYYELDEKSILEQKRLKQINNLRNHKELLNEHKDVLKQYTEHQLGRTDIKTVSVYNLISQLVPFLIGMQKKIEGISGEDVDSYFRNFRGNIKCAESTISHKIVVIKQFFKWFYDKRAIKYEGEFPPVISFLKLKRPENKLRQSDLLTREDIRRMIEAMPKARDKAILAVLCDSGARVGELLNVNIGDVVHEENSADLNVDGKTGKRTITIVESYPYLLQWLNQHPLKSHMNAPMFLNVSNGQFGRRLLYQGLVSIIRTAAKRTGLMRWAVVESDTAPKGISYKRVSGKKITPHLFRHSRATELASKGWTEPELRIRFGWTTSSSTPSIYCHIGRKAIKEKLLKENGFLNNELIAKELRQKEALKPKICPRCQTVCTPESIACNRCGMALSIYNAEKIREMKKKTNNFEEKIKELPIRPELIEGKMTTYDYKKRLIREDPFLKAEFEDIAREVMKSLMLQKEIQESKTMLTAPITNRPKTNGNREEVINLRKKGWSMEDICKELKLGYGTINTICREEKLSKIY